MFDKSRGMTWYRVLQCILVLWIINSFASACSGSYYYEISVAFPVYAIFMRLSAVVVMFFSIVLFVSMKRYSYSMLKWIKVLCTVCMLNYIIALLILSAEANVNVLDAGVGTAIGGCIGTGSILIPSYFYMKKRFSNEIYFTPVQNADEENVAESPKISKNIAPISMGIEKEAEKDDMKDDFPIIRFCRYCGKELRDGSKYCDECGKKVRS